MGRIARGSRHYWFLHMAWSLVSELQAIFETENLAQGFLKAGVIDDLSKFCDVKTVSEWYRAGSETYVLILDVIIRDELPKRLVLKACVPDVSAGNSIEHIQERWIHKRHMVAKYGVSTPVLYGFNSGVILEEYIPYALTDVVGERAEPTLLAALAHTVGVIARLGFLPISVVSDMRSRGSDAVLVDFGSDLGEPGVARSNSTREQTDLKSLQFLTTTSLDLASLARAVYRQASSGALPH